MPVEIREIVIKTNLYKKAPEPKESFSRESDIIQRLKEDILAICLEKLEEKIRLQKER